MIRRSFRSRRLWTKSETKLWTINFFLGTCVLYASRVALPICAVAMAQEYGWSKTDSGTVLSCFFWGYALTQLIAGSVADLVGGEKILPFSTFAWATLTLFTPQLFDFAYLTRTPLLVLLFVRIFTGVGQGFHIPSMASMVSRHLTSSDKGRVLGICLAGSHSGSVIAGGIGSILLEWLGWRSLFHFVGFLSLMWCVMFNFLSKNLSHKRRTNVVFDSSGKIAVKENSAEQCTMDTGLKTESAVVPWASLLRHTAFWAASIAQYCGANAYFTMFSWLPSYFSDNFPEAKAYVYNVVPSLAIVVTSLFSPFCATKLLTRGHSVTFTRRLIESISLVGMALCFIAVSIFSNSFQSSLVLFTMAMAMRGLHHGGVAVNPTDFAPNHTGSVFGVFNAFSAITGFVGVYIAGWILQISGNFWSYVFIFTAFQCILGALVYGILGTGKRII